MKREISKHGIDIFNVKEGWRAHISILSQINMEHKCGPENFDAKLSLPLDNPSVPPDEIIKELREKFIKAFEEITAELKTYDFIRGE
jgi:hypothetical protein